MRSNIVRTINGQDYEIWHLPPIEASNILIKLSKIIIEPIGKAIGKQTSIDINNIDINLGDATEILTKRLDEKEVQTIIETMFKYINIKTDKGGFMPVNLIRDFTGKLMDMFKVLKEAMEVNYSDFFYALSFLKKEKLTSKISEITSETQM